MDAAWRWLKTRVSTVHSLVVAPVPLTAPWQIPGFAFWLMAYFENTANAYQRRPYEPPHPAADSTL